MARAYVCLDRAAYLRLQGTAELRDAFARIKQRLQEQEALGDFERLVVAGAEPEEILWLLSGCHRLLPGFTHAEQLFGRKARKLRKHLGKVNQAAQAIEGIRRSPFGWLLSAAAFPFGSEMTTNLRIYVALAKAYQRAFSRGSEWFLNIAKARLVIHVMHRTEKLHDKEVSGLIAAVASMKLRKTARNMYNVEAHCQWRQEHSGLIDPSLDPYTVQTEAERQEGWGLLKKLTVTDTDLAQPFQTWAANFAKIIQSRLPQPPKR